MARKREWEILLDEDSDYFLIVDAVGNKICSVADEGNAKLIVTAPKMFEALRQLLELAEGEYPEDQWAEFYPQIIQSRAVLAEASGEIKS